MNTSGQVLSLDFDYHIQREIENGNIEYVRGALNIVFDFIKNSGTVEVESNEDPHMSTTIQTLEDLESFLADLNKKYERTRKVTFAPEDDHVVVRKSGE